MLQPFEHGCRWEALASSQQASASIASWKSSRLSAACLPQVTTQHESAPHPYAQGKMLHQGFEELPMAYASAFPFHQSLGKQWSAYTECSNLSVCLQASTKISSIHSGKVFTTC